MNTRQQLIEELEQAPDDVVQKVLEFLHQIQVSKKEHPLAKFAGILSDAEAEEMQHALLQNFGQIDEEDRVMNRMELSDEFMLYLLAQGERQEGSKTGSKLEEWYQEALVQLREQLAQRRKFRSIADMLRVRCGEVGEELAGIVEKIASMSSKQFIVLSFRLSVEELLERFTKEAEGE